MDLGGTRPLYVAPDNTHTRNTFLSTQYTLRRCNEDYRRETGSFQQSDRPAEFDCYSIPGKVPSLLEFDNFQGHVVNDYTRIFNPPMHHESIKEFYSHITRMMERSVKRSRAWDIDGTKRYNILDIIRNVERNYHSELIKSLKTQVETPYKPISVHPIHAHSESLEKYGRQSVVFKMPSISTIVTGPFGGFHNNVSVEMGFVEEEGVKDMSKRTYDRDHLSFLCCGYTSHSSDAGRARRLCSYTRIRVSSSTPLWPLADCLNRISIDGNWTVYCMGSTFNTSLVSIKLIISHLDTGLKRYFATQFNYPHIEPCAAPPTYILYSSQRVMYISISPGVVLRSTPDDSMADSSMVRLEQDPSLVKKIKLPMVGDESIKYFFNPWYLMAYLTKLNRQPRPEFACGQLTQGVFAPWSPATARVSPCHVSSPMVATQFTRDMEDDYKVNPGAMWDIFPGEDMTVCFMNLPLNYEDSMIVSSKFADLGGFSTISECTYRISEKDPVPKEGERLCGKKYKWWKMPCPNSCKCFSEHYDNNIINAGRIPTSRVTSVGRTKDGGISIKVLSFAQFMTGDKISMTAGQKGVAHIVECEDLPVIVMPDGTSFTADLYMAIGSIVSRQTNGMILESGIAMRASIDGIKATVGYADDGEYEECSYIINSATGEPMRCQYKDTGYESLIKATVGMIRVVNQTQMTRERHHLTHNSEGKRSLGTTSGRASGGGVAAAEMDFHAMFSSGLIGCAQELFDRGNVVRVPFCMTCGRIVIVKDHPRCDPSHILRVRMSYDTAVLDSMSASINQSSNVYTIEHV